MNEVTQIINVSIVTDTKSRDLIISLFPTPSIHQLAIRCFLCNQSVPDIKRAIEN